MQFLAELQIVFFYVFIILAAIPKKRQQIREIMERPKEGSNQKSLAAFPGWEVGTYHIFFTCTCAHLCKDMENESGGWEFCVWIDRANWMREMEDGYGLRGSY